MRRVVITGMGMINPLGHSVPEFWENVKAGKCGIAPITNFDTEEFKTKLAAEVKGFDPGAYIDPKEAKRMSRFSQFAVAAAKEAYEDAALAGSGTDPERIGVFVSTGVGGISDCEVEIENLLTKGPRRVNSLFIPMMIGNMAAGNVAIATGANGPCLDVVSACASSNNAIGEAYYAIAANRADVIIAGGTESSIGRLSIAGFMNLRALSNNPDPNRGSIPFDKEREGFVMGEGAGILILEELEHAKARGAKILGEVAGYGTTCDAFHITAPCEDGAQGARAMRLALETAGISPEEVSYINAHGTSTPLNDKTETVAVKSVFGKHAYNIPMSSSKSMFGHLLGAAGAVEAIVSLKAIADRFVPATINFREADPACDLDIVPNVGRENQELRYVLSNSLGFGGHNASVLFKKWEDA